jgi:D-alanine-D-alanine ligase
MKPHSIACVVDDDIIGAVKREERSSRRAIYDISVVRALRRLASPVHLVPAVERSARTVEELMRLRPGLVFNLAFSATPSEAPFAGALEMLGLPYTGSGPLGIGLANDKIRSRRLLQAAGVRVPRFVELARSARPATIDLAPPFIVKPVSLGNSLGIQADSVVDSYADAWKRADRIWRRFGVPAVCDEFIVGREFQVGMVEAGPGVFRITAIVELHFAAAEPGRGFKSEAVGVEDRRRVYDVSVRPAVLSRRKAAGMAEIARAAADVLGLRGYAKLDLRMDDQERIVVIEANANPGLWSESDIWRRPSFETNLKRIIKSALRRARGASP